MQRRSRQTLVEFINNILRAPDNNTMKGLHQTRFKDIFRKKKKKKRSKAKGSIKLIAKVVL